MMDDRPETCSPSSARAGHARRGGTSGRPVLLVAVLLFLAAPLLPQDAPPPPPPDSPAESPAEASAETDFLRFLPGKSRGEGTLETAIVHYAGKDGVVVDLIGAVHVADAGYYRDLERRFDKYDAVLYELVKPKGPVDPSARSDSMLSLFQRGLKDLLALEFQLDGIDYGRENFVHADLDVETFQRLQKERGESILSLMFAAMRAEFERQKRGESSSEATVFELLGAFFQKDRAGALKLLFARELENMERILAGIEEHSGDGEKGSVIVEERNKAALRVLAGVLADGKKKVAIFYGAAHMPDLERRLTGELGYRKVREEWLTAWDIRAGGGKEASADAGGGEAGEKDAEAKEPQKEPEKEPEAKNPPREDSGPGARRRSG